MQSDDKLQIGIYFSVNGVKGKNEPVTNLYDTAGHLGSGVLT